VCTENAIISSVRTTFCSILLTIRVSGNTVIKKTKLCRSVSRLFNSPVTHVCDEEDVRFGGDHDRKSILKRVLSDATRVSFSFRIQC
jgi:hypothetical protein